MEDNFNHTILVVDSDEEVARSIDKLVGKRGVTVIFAPGGIEGIEKIKQALKPFSLIIAEQGLSGIKGYEFLEKAREITPDTVCFLVTGHPNMDVIINAVNRGVIHRYILKPWDPDEFLKLIGSGLSQYEVVLENERLLPLAKEQNAKLYMLNCDLKERGESNIKTLGLLDKKIEELTLKLDAMGKGEEEEKSKLMAGLEPVLKEGDLLTKEALEPFYAELMGELFKQFKDLAERNGFSMPESA